MYGVTYHGYFFRYSDGNLDVLGQMNVGLGPAPQNLRLGPDNAHFYALFGKSIFALDFLDAIDTVAVAKGRLAYEPAAFGATGTMYGSTTTGGPTGAGGVFKVDGY
jgi:hypothetical protein